MKRILFAILIILLLSSQLFAADNNKKIEMFEPLFVEFTSDTTIISGFADKLVTGTTLGDATDITGQSKKFEYDSDNGWFYIDNIFYYVQVFVSSNVKIEIKGTPLKQNSSVTNPKTVHWKSMPGIYGEGYIDTETGQSIVIDESTMAGVDRKFPRTYSDEIQIRVSTSDDAENDIDTSADYSATLTLTVTQI